MYSKDASNNTIEFRYKKDVLFNDVSLLSNYMSKNLSTKDGTSLTDNYAISDDERDLVYLCIRTILPDLYEAMVKITSAVSSAFEDDKVIPDENEVDVHYVSFTMRDNGAYNDNVLTMVDASLYNSLKYGTLKEVYSTVLQPEFYNTCANRFVAELYKLKQRLFQLKKKSVVSSIS